MNFGWNSDLGERYIMNYIFNSPGALNSELPAGREHAPVFKHAPSSPINLYKFGILTNKLHLLK